MQKLLLLSTLLLAFVLVGCSGGGSEGETAQSENGDTQTSMESSDTETRTIDVIGIDKLKYVVAEQSDGLQTGETITVNGTDYYVLEGITASTGEELTINLRTISNLPPQAMSHNWLLLDPDTDPQMFNDASIQAKDNDYVAPDMEDRVIIDTGLAGNGETKSVTFSTPDAAGAYEYLCTFPGHFTAGMRGTLTVE